MAKPSPTVFLFHGDDDLRIEEEVARLRAKMGNDEIARLNMADFDGETTPINEILAAAMAFPFLGDKRFVLVKGLLAHITRKGAGETGKKAVAALEDALPNLPPSTRLVFAERAKLPDTHKIVKLARENTGDKGAGNGFEKAYLLPKDSTQWIIGRAKDEYGATITPGAASALATVIGNDLRAADNELIKLSAYVGGQRPINEEDVATLTPYLSEASLFDMIDALAEGRAGAATKLAMRLLEDERSDTDIFQLYGMIIRQFRLLIMAKEHLQNGGSREEVAGVLGIHPYPAGKVATQSRAFDLPALERIYRALADTDLKIKTGRIDPRIALNMLIATLAR